MWDLMADISMIGLCGIFSIYLSGIFFIILDDTKSKFLKYQKGIPTEINEIQKHFNLTEKEAKLIYNNTNTYEAYYEKMLKDLFKIIQIDIKNNEKRTL